MKRKKKKSSGKKPNVASAPAGQQPTSDPFSHDTVTSATATSDTAARHAAPHPPAPAPRGWQLSEPLPSPLANLHVEGHDPILVTVSRAAFALIMLFALLLLWRGHNAPGGGFIAGLMTAAALLLHRMATREDVLRGRNPATFIPVGAALSFLTGLVPYLLGKPFLKTDYGYITTPLTGEFEWATAMIFDIGVYLVVIGSALSIAYALIDVWPHLRVEGDA